MCDAQRVTSEPATPAESRPAPDTVALAKVVARQRAEMDRLRDLAARTAVLEQAKGAVMALTGCSPDAAEEELRRRAADGTRSLLEECWVTLGGLATTPAATAPRPDPGLTPGSCPASARDVATTDEVRRPSDRSAGNSSMWPHRRISPGACSSISRRRSAPAPS